MDETNPFTTSIRVRIGDINYGGHMGNDRYLLLFQDARIRFLETLGLSEGDIGDGTSLIISEAHIRYRNEAFLNDVLMVQVNATDLGVVKFRFNFMVNRESDGQIIAEGHTWMGTYDYHERKICKIPDSFREKIKECPRC